MDLVYIPDVLTFGSFRNPQYRDYEQPWNSNYFDDGKTAYRHQQRHHQQQQQQQQQQQLHHQQQQQRGGDSGSKESCQLCRENKRRSLAAYIRGKSRNKSCSEICEEEEEMEEQTETSHKQDKTKSSKSSA